MDIEKKLRERKLKLLESRIRALEIIVKWNKREDPNETIWQFADGDAEPTDILRAM